MLVEIRDGADTLIELLQAVALVWRVDGILAQAEANQQRLNAQNALKTADDWNRAARIEWQWLLAEGINDSLLRSLVCRHIGWRNIRRTAV